MGGKSSSPTVRLALRLALPEGDLVLDVCSSAHAIGRHKMINVSSEQLVRSETGDERSDEGKGTAFCVRAGMEEVIAGLEREL